MQPVKEYFFQATGITEEEFAPFADETLNSALQTPFSVLCRDGEIIRDHFGAISIGGD